MEVFAKFPPNAFFSSLSCLFPSKGEGPTMSTCCLLTLNNTARACARTHTHTQSTSCMKTHTLILLICKSTQPTQRVAYLVSRATRNRQWTSTHSFNPPPMKEGTSTETLVCVTLAFIRFSLISFFISSPDEHPGTGESEHVGLGCVLGTVLGLHFEGGLDIKPSEVKFLIRIMAWQRKRGDVKTTNSSTGRHNGPWTINKGA